MSSSPHIFHLLLVSHVPFTTSTSSSSFTLPLPRHRNTLYNRDNTIYSKDTQCITNLSKNARSKSIAIKNCSGVKSSRVAQWCEVVGNVRSLHHLGEDTGGRRHTKNPKGKRKKWRKRDLAETIISYQNSMISKLRSSRLETYKVLVSWTEMMAKECARTWTSPKIFHWWLGCLKNVGDCSLKSVVRYLFNVQDELEITIRTSAWFDNSLKKCCIEICTDRLNNIIEFLIFSYNSFSFNSVCCCHWISHKEFFKWSHKRHWFWIRFVSAHVFEACKKTTHEFMPRVSLGAQFQLCLQHLVM